MVEILKTVNTKCRLRFQKHFDVSNQLINYRQKFFFFQFHFLISGSIAFNMILISYSTISMESAVLFNVVLLNEDDG